MPEPVVWEVLFGNKFVKHWLFWNDKECWKGRDLSATEKNPESNNTIEWQFEHTSRNPALIEHNKDISIGFSEAKITAKTDGHKLKNILQSGYTDA